LKLKFEKSRLKFIFIKLKIFSAVYFHFYSLKKAEYFLEKGRLKLKLEKAGCSWMEKGRLKLKLEKAGCSWMENGRLQLDGKKPAEVAVGWKKAG
jgi:hypothetical protein